MQVVNNEKENILGVINSLPNKTSIEETMERLYLLSKIERGCKEADNNIKISHVEAKKRMKKWAI